LSWRKWFLGAAVLGCINLTNAQAAQIYSVDGGMIFRGSIITGDYQKFFKIAKRAEINHVFLDSAGGQVMEALKLAERFRADGYSTHVSSNSVCASACILLLAGGVVRSADQGAKIAVHVGSGLFSDEVKLDFQKILKKHGVDGARMLASNFERTAAIMTLKQAHFLLKSGVSLDLLGLASSIHHLDARELSISEARRFNLINSD
jgi:hypothetical protein